MTERRISIDEVYAAADAGKLDEVFGTGTAAVISPVGELNWDGRVIVINNGKIGKNLANAVRRHHGHQWGEKPDAFQWTLEV